MDIAPDPARRARIDELTSAYKAEHGLLERHRTVKVSDSGPVGLRLDGRSFHTFTKDFEHPFDVRIEDAMDAACRALLQADLGIELCYVQSDEITLIIPRDRVPFDGRLEKLLSVPAAVAASAFALSIAQAGAPMPTPPSFDARLLTLDDEDAAVACVSERQLDCVKNAVSMLVHWTLVLQEGLTPRQAHRRLMPMSMRDRMDLCEQLGVPFGALSQARRLGRVHTFQIVTRTGHNPIAGVDVDVFRRELVQLDPTPDFRALTGLPWAPTRPKTRAS